MAQESITISIIIPVYNVSAYIERCIQSVIAQTRPCFECILVDDASPDDSIAKCERLIASYQGPTRFIILHHEKNRGLSAARNTGFDAAAGDYIFYLDSDDAITPDCLEKLSAPIERDRSIEMVMGNYEEIADGHPLLEKGHKFLPERDIVSKEENRRYFFSDSGYPIMAWNKLIKKRFLESNDLRFSEGLLFEDNPWAFYMMKHLSHVYIVPDITLLHYVRPRSITTGANKETYAHFHAIIFKEIASHFTPEEQEREASFYIHNFCVKYSLCQTEPLFRQIAPQFKEALSSGHHAKDLFYLFILEQTSRSAAGRFLFGIAISVRRAILSLSRS